jgi:hypothetical protein
MSSFRGLFFSHIEYFSEVAVFKILWMNVVLVGTGLYTFYCIYCELSNAVNGMRMNLKKLFCCRLILAPTPRDPPIAITAPSIPPS